MEPRSQLGRRCLVALAVVCLATASSSAATLESVLKKMDETSEGFHGAQACFTWTVYNHVINDVAEQESGKIYFRRAGHDTQMAADIDTPDVRQILFSQGKIQVYQRKTDTVDVIDASAHKDEFETYIVLGFGSSGDSLKKSFSIKDAGEDTVDTGTCSPNGRGDSIQTAKIELTPNSPAIRRQFAQIILWINPKSGLSVQQKLIADNGDYRLAKYSEIRCCDQKLPDKIFKLKKTSNTKTVNH